MLKLTWSQRTQAREPLPLHSQMCTWLSTEHTRYGSKICFPLTIPLRGDSTWVSKSTTWALVQTLPNPTYRQLSFKNPGTQRWECRACSSTPTTPTKLNFRHQNTAHHHHCWPAGCRLPCQPWQVLFHSTPFFPSHPGLTTCSPVFYLLAHCWSDLLLQSKSLKLAAKGHLKMVTSSNIPPHHLTKHRRFCYPALMAAAQFWKGCSMSGNLHLSNHLSTQICTEDSRNKPMSECYQQGRCSQLKNIHRS